jgi:hypothetical protein
VPNNLPLVDAQAYDRKWVTCSCDIEGLTHSSRVKKLVLWFFNFNENFQPLNTIFVKGWTTLIIFRKLFLFKK